jgi:AcrR family transcriptional regulator
MSSPVTPIRRTQEERRAATRGALLDATIECLVEYGYHGVTTSRVADRAGVSRGAQVHYFPAKNDLVMAAVQHLAARRAAALIESDRGRLRTSSDWVGDTLDLLWEAHQGPLFEASMELWIAARTDPELREHLAAFERTLTSSMLSLAPKVLGERLMETDPDVVQDFYVVLETIRGLRMLSFVHPSSKEKLDARWQQAKIRLRRMIGEPVSPVSLAENQ